MDHMEVQEFSLADLLTGKISLEGIEQVIAKEEKENVSREEVFDFLESLDKDGGDFFDDVETFLKESIESHEYKKEKLFKKINKVEKEIDFLYKLLENYASEK